MNCPKLLAWVERSRTRTDLLSYSSQPLTVKQYTHRVNIQLSNCTRDLIAMTKHNLLACLNPGARQNRVYGLTGIGLKCTAMLRKKRSHSEVEYFSPNVDWQTYGELCYSHRSAVIKALSSNPLQPYDLRRKARQRNPGSRMNTNNVREVLRVLLKLGVVRKVYIRKRVHPRYVLDENARPYQELLNRAGVVT